MKFHVYVLMVLFFSFLLNVWIECMILVHIYILDSICVHICGLMNMGMNARIGEISNLISNFYIDDCSDA